MFKKASLWAIKFYQFILSPDQGLFRSGSRTCRFYPSCSEYTKLAITKYGFLAGAAKGLKRLAHCHPFNPGGFDPLL